MQFGPSHLGWVRHGAARGQVWPVRRSPGAAGPELTTGALQPAAVGLGTEHVPRLPFPSWKPPPRPELQAVQWVSAADKHRALPSASPYPRLRGKSWGRKDRSTSLLERL